MKINLLFFITAAIITATQSLQAQQIIHSTTQGGLWPNNTTWIEAVPSGGDSVVMQGPVSMLSYTGWCNSLNITSDGSLGGNGGQGNLYIYGSIHNNGNILGSMNYVLQGNLVNNQPWTGVDNHLLFTGMNHTIKCATGASINAHLLANDSLHNFSLLSDVILNTTGSSNFGFSQLDAGIHKLTVTGGQFTNCRVHALDTLQFDSYISDLDLTGDYKLKGTIICYYNLNLYDRATNYGSIHFASGVGGDPLKLRGDFINEGTMNHAWVQVEKNITNNGIWSSYRTEFIGSGDKHISHSAGHPFGGGEQFTSDNSGSEIFLDSDVEFTVPVFHLNNNTLNCGDHLLTANTSFFDGTIHSASEIAGNNDFWNTSFSGNIIFSGNNRFSNSIMNGSIENTGLLKDITFYGGNFTSYIQLINSNSIQSLQLKIYGNLTNYGTIDNNSTVDLLGIVNQYINFTNGINSPVRFYSNVTGTSYQWMKDGVDISNQVYDNLYFNTLQLVDAGIYKCRVVTVGGETVYSREIFVNNVTSTKEVELLEGVHVSPNPVLNQAVLSWHQNKPDFLTIDICDLNGKVHQSLEKMRFDIGHNDFNLALSPSLKTGTYIIILRSSSGTKTVKFIKVK